VEAPPPGSEQLRSALHDFLHPRKLTSKLPSLLALLNPITLRRGALRGRYEVPRWSDDPNGTTPPSLRAHWRAQACVLLNIKEKEMPESVTTALKTFLWPGALDTTRGEHLAWLVKVPGFVAKAWTATAEASARADDLYDGEDDAEGVEAKRTEFESNVNADISEDKEVLGRMRVAVDPFRADPAKRRKHFLTLTESLASAHQIPSSYDMQATSEDRPMCVFSDVRENTAAAAAAAAARERQARAAGFEDAAACAALVPADAFVLEGKVSEKFDVRPASATDEKYRQVSLRRMEEATKKTRVMGDVKGVQRVVPLPTARNVVKRLDGAEEDSSKKSRRERLEKSVLENALMGLFERRGSWTFKQLVEETRQPAVWLKEVVADLAVLNRRGPNTGMWTLKDMYKRKGGAGSGAAKS
jgi:transcription initiation factor TFIIF subunit beta